MEGSQTPTGPQTPTRRWWLVLVPLLAAVAYLFARELSATAYDDSYFFKRFALNALDHGVFAWNMEDGPVYGCTSQLYMLVATVITAISRDYYVLGVKVFNTACVVGLSAVILDWCSRATRRPTEGALVGLLVVGTPMVLTTITTGMETAMSLLLVASSLWLMFKPGGQRSSPWLAAGLTVLVYLCRPDAAAVLGIAWCSDALLRRTVPWRYLLALGALLVPVLAGFWSYYGTAFPLPFYMKTGGFSAYGDNVIRLGWLVKRQHFGSIVAFFAPLLWIAARAKSTRGRALLLATIGFWVYHLGLTNEIMGYHGRFYAPGVVPLAFAAAEGWDEFREHRRPGVTAVFVGVWAAAVAAAYAAKLIPTGEGFFISLLPWPTYTAQVVLAAWVMFRPRTVPVWADLGLATVALLGASIGWKTPKAPRALSDAEVLRKHSREVTTVRGIFDVARCLPQARTVYHSEMGVPGLVLPNTRVVDMVGLLSKQTVLERRPFEELCAEDQPEALFLPHRNYQRLNAEIREAPCFTDYRRIVDNSSSPLYVRRELARDFLYCAEDVHRWRKPRRKGKRKGKRRRKGKKKR